MPTSADTTDGAEVQLIGSWRLPSYEWKVVGDDAPQRAVFAELDEVAEAAVVLHAGADAQICLGLSGGFGPTIRPWFQDTRGEGIELLIWRTPSFGAPPCPCQSCTVAKHWPRRELSLPNMRVQVQKRGSRFVMPLHRFPKRNRRHV